MVSKPRISKGTRDFSPKQLANRDYIFSTIKSNFKKFGYFTIQSEGGLPHSSKRTNTLFYC